MGFEVNFELIQAARAAAFAAGVPHTASFRRADLFTVDLSAADVVTLYLLRDVNARLLGTTLVRPTDLDQTGKLALAPGSPALNAISTADCAVAKDQRGVSRPQPINGKCDIGAYERKGP